MDFGWFVVLCFEIVVLVVVTGGLALLTGYVVDLLSIVCCLGCGCFLIVTSGWFCYFGLLVVIVLYYFVLAVLVCFLVWFYCGYLFTFGDVLCALSLLV